MAILQDPTNPLPLVIVGESPGKEELRTGIPFVGASGRVLSNLCRKAGLNRDKCRITNVVDVLPPKWSGFGGLDQQVVEDGVRRLKERLEKWRPNVVLAVGAEALKALTGLKPITKYRGAVIESNLIPGLKVVATLHPANLLRGNMQMAPIVALDISKAVKEMKSRRFVSRERDWHIFQDNFEAKETFESMHDSVVCVDIETAGSVLTSFGVATSPNQSYVMPNKLIRSRDGLVLIDKFCRDSSIKKIYHNACYDALWLAYYTKILTKGIYFDTMIAQHCCYPIWPKSLAFCVSVYMNEIYWKDEGKAVFTPGCAADWEKLYHYNALDTMFTYEIYEKLKKELVELKVDKVFWNDMKLVRPLLFAMLHGVNIDEEEVKKLEKKNDSIIEKLETLKKGVIGDLNVKSPKQLKELFYGKKEEGGWNFKAIKRKGKVTTDAKALQKLEALPTPQQPLFGLIRTLKEHHKLSGFFSFQRDPDGRVRTAYKPTGTISGRISSAKGITGSGSNLQNQPKIIRSMYVPDPGCIFIQADLSQAEARIVAALCGDMDWLKQFDSDDVHWYVAEQLFGKPREKLVKKIHRQMSKRVSHGTHYLMSWNLLKELLRVTAKEAKGLMALYYETRPNLKPWQNAVKKHILQHREITTALGRRLIYPSVVGESEIRQGVSFEPQSLCGQYNNNAWIRAHEKVDYAKILLQVHDSLLYQVPAKLSYVEKCLIDVKELTEVNLTVKSRVTGEEITFKIPVDFEIGYNWKNLEECSIENVAETFRNL